MNLSIQLAVVTPFSQNCRVIIDAATNRACVVDPGGDVQQIVEAAHASGAEIESVFLTHAHLDHAGGVRRLLALVERLSGKTPKLAAHRLEAQLRTTISQQAAMFGLPPGMFENCPEPDLYLEDGQTFRIGTVEATVLFTPGHPPGHIVLFLPANTSAVALENGTIQNLSVPLLVSGDTLFARSIGRTDLAGGSFPVLIDSIRTKLFNLPDETVVLPGHGPETSIGVEKRTNPFLD